jgi:hypothetical protein
VGGCAGGLRQNWRNEWWLVSVVEEGEKACRGEREREEVVVAAPPLMRSWVGGDDGGQAGGKCGGGRRPR